MVDELAVCVVVVWVIPEVPRRFFLHSVRDVSKNRTSPELFERDDDWRCDVSDRGGGFR
jgi:hypothetical protein